MSAKAVRWVPLDRDWCTLYEINKSMFMFMFMLSDGGEFYCRMPQADQSLEPFVWRAETTNINM